MIPQRKLKNRVILEVFQGASSVGDVYGGPVVHRAWVEAQETVVVNQRGEEEVSNTSVFLNPVDAPPGTRVTLWPGTPEEHQSVVLNAQQYREHRLAHTVLRLR